MLTVGDIIRKNPDGHVGIEIEVEATGRLPVITDDIWTSKPESSLRGHCMEYITINPIKVDSSFQSNVLSLTNRLNTSVINPSQDSPRTSIHVHVNVCDFNPVQLLTFITAYWLFENPLFNYCGPLRKSNLFCLRLADAEGALEIVKSGIQTNDFFSALNGDRIRYSGMNLNAVYKFGSVEFRGMRGTTDPEIIGAWTKALWHLKMASKKYADPSELLDKYALQGSSNFLKELFPAKFANILQEYKNWDEGVHANACTLSTMAYSEKWDAWLKNQKPKLKRTDDRRGAMPRFEDILDDPMPPPRPMHVIDEVLVDDFFRPVAVPPNLAQPGARVIY